MATSVQSSISPWFTNLAVSPLEARANAMGRWATSPSANVDPEGGVVLTSDSSSANISSSGTAGAPRVTITAGRFVVPMASQYGLEGLFPTATLIDLDAPHATLPRRDLIVCRGAIGTETNPPSANNGLWLERVSGTPASVPSPPATPANAIALWDARVPAGGGTLQFTDHRRWTRPPGTPRLALTASELARPGSHVYDMRIVADGTLEMWLGNEWQSVSTPAVWNEEPSDLTYHGWDGRPPGTVSLGGGNEQHYVRYRLIGKVLEVRYWFQWNQNAIDGWNGGTGNITTTLPAGLVSSPFGETRLHAHIWVRAGTNSNEGPNWDFLGNALVRANSNLVQPMYPANADWVNLEFYRVAKSPGVAGEGSPYIAGGFPEGGNMTINGTIEVA